jgi:hypothetical protein
MRLRTTLLSAACLLAGATTAAGAQLARTKLHFELGGGASFFPTYVQASDDYTRRNGWAATLLIGRERSPGNAELGATVVHQRPTTQSAAPSLVAVRAVVGVGSAPVGSARPSARIGLGLAGLFIDAQPIDCAANQSICAEWSPRDLKTAAVVAAAGGGRAGVAPQRRDADAPRYRAGPTGRAPGGGGRTGATGGIRFVW